MAQEGAGGRRRAQEGAGGRRGAQEGDGFSVAQEHCHPTTGCEGLQRNKGTLRLHTLPSFTVTCRAGSFILKSSS